MSTIGFKVLLVEDSALLAERAREWLDQMNDVDLIDVVETESAAVNVINSLPLDLIILDLQLKQGTGFGVMREINRMENRPRVVVLTNYDIAEYRRNVMALGADHFLDKANDFASVPKIIEQMIEDKAAVEA
jgi:two-component system OmpR family response regulator